MPLSTRDLLAQAVSDAAWAQWTSLGVLADAGGRESRCLDPEALIWLTFAHPDMLDARLVDAARDWLGINKHLLSIHRLRNVFAEDGAALSDVTAILARQREVAKSSRIKTATKVVEPDPMVNENLAIRLRLLMDAGSRAEVARFLLTWPEQGADAQHVATATAFAKRNVNDILLAFVKGGVVREAWAGNRRVFSADKDRWCAFLLVRPETLPGYMPWIALFRSAAHILDWFDAQAMDESPYLRSSSVRDVVEQVRSDLVSCGLEVPDPSRFPAEAFLGPFDALVGEVAEVVAPQGV